MNFPELGSSFRLDFERNAITVVSFYKNCGNCGKWGEKEIIKRISPHF